MSPVSHCEHKASQHVLLVRFERLEERGTDDGEEEQRQRLAALLLVAQHDLIDGPAVRTRSPSFMPFS